VPINSPRYRWSELDGEQRAELNQQIVELTEAFLDDITHLQAGQSFGETTPSCCPRRPPSGRACRCSASANALPNMRLARNTDSSLLENDQAPPGVHPETSGKGGSAWHVARR